MNNSPNISLRVVSESNLGKFLELQKAAFRETYDRYRDEETSPVAETIEQLRFRHQEAGSTYFFLVSRDNVAGGVRVIRSGKRSRKEWILCFWKKEP